MAIKCSRQIRNGTELLPWQGPRHCSVVGHCQVVAAEPAAGGMKFDIPFDIGICCCKKFCRSCLLATGARWSPFWGTTTDHYYCSVRRPHKSFSATIQKTNNIYTSVLHTPVATPASISSMLAAHLSAPTMRLLRDWHGNLGRPAKQKEESRKAENRGKMANMSKMEQVVLRGKALAQPFIADRSFKWINGKLQVLEFHVLVQDERKLHLGLNNFRWCLTSHPFSPKKLRKMEAVSIPV